MRLVLVNPSFQTRVRRIAQTSVGPPLGLAYLAAAVRAKGFEVRVVDANVFGLSEARAAAAAFDLQPDVVGITAATPTIARAGEIAGHLKALDPGITTIVGGPHATALPARTLAEFPAVDIVARGEAEGSLPALLAALDRGASRRALTDVPGFVLREEDGSVVDTGAAARLDCLDRLPLPARDLLPMRRYRTVDSDRFTTMLAMRGCPCSCVYCYVPELFGRRMRYRSPAAVVAEMDEVHARHGVTLVSFVDDTFTTRREWVEEFSDHAQTSGVARRVRWTCLTRADMVDRALLAAMRRAGCLRIEFGIESASAAGVAFLDKGQSEEKVLAAFRDARAVGLSTMGFLILNIPGETEADIVSSFELARRADPDFLQVSFLTPYPGTALRAEAERRGWITTDDWSRYLFLRDIVLDHGGLPPAKLERIYSQQMRRFYLRPRTAIKFGRLVLGGRSELRPLMRTVMLGLAGLLAGQSEGDRREP